MDKNKKDLLTAMYSAQLNGVADDHKAEDSKQPETNSVVLGGK